MSLDCRVQNQPRGRHIWAETFSITTGISLLSLSYRNPGFVSRTAVWHKAKLTKSHSSKPPDSFTCLVQVQPPINLSSDLAQTKLHGLIMESFWSSSSSIPTPLATLGHATVISCSNGSPASPLPPTVTLFTEARLMLLQCR
jgi:hypothetical protein